MSLSASEESTKQKQAEVSFSPLWATSSREPPSQNRGLRNRITHITPCGAFCPALGLQNSIALSIPKTAALNSGIISRSCPPIAFRQTGAQQYVLRVFPRHILVRRCLRWGLGASGVPGFLDVDAPYCSPELDFVDCSMIFSCLAVECFLF